MQKKIINRRCRYRYRYRYRYSYHLDN